MEARLVVLKLVLDALRIPTKILTIADRKRVQKGVYLGQLTGVDLGYRFGWYLKGPYSPSLTKDYFALADAIASGDKIYESRELQPDIEKKLRRVLRIMPLPPGVRLPEEDWLELVSSVHYLRAVSRSSTRVAQDTLRKKKPALTHYYAQAERTLQKANLLQ